MNSTTQPWETPHFGRGPSLINTGEERKRKKKNDRKMENMAGTSTRFIWGRDSEPLEKKWRAKLGPQMGGGYTKGVVTSRHGISKPARFFSGVWKIKEGKIGLFYSPDPWTQWGKVKTVPGNNLSSHYLNPLRMRTAGHAPGLMFHHDDEKRISIEHSYEIIVSFPLLLYFPCW